MKNIERNGRMITCILPKGEALGLLKKLFDRGVTRANFAFARGFDIHDIDNPRTGFPDAEEKEIVTVIAKDTAEGEDLFSFIYSEGNIHRRGGGFIQMMKIHSSSTYELPKIEDTLKLVKSETTASA